MWCSTLDIVISYSQQELIDITLSIACSASDIPQLAAWIHSHQI